MAILQLEERPRVRALIRRDRFDRFVSVLVFVPRDRYTSDLRERIGLALAEMYDGRVSAFFPNFSHTHLTRVQFIIGRNPGEGPDPAQGEVEAAIRAIVRTFEDDLADALNDAFPPDRAAELCRDYIGAFGSDYRAVFGAADARRRHRDRRGAHARRRRGALLPAAGHAGERGGAAAASSRRRPIPLSRRVPLPGESRLLGHRRAHLPHRPARAPAALPPRHDGSR